MSADPREGEFAEIYIRQAAIPVDGGPWSFDHWGFGQFGFRNEAGDFVPVQSVAVAYRSPQKGR